MAPSPKYDVTQKKGSGKTSTSATKNPAKVSVHAKRVSVYDRLYRKPTLSEARNDKSKKLIRAYTKIRVKDNNPPVFDRLYSKGTASSISKGSKSKSSTTENDKLDTNQHRSKSNLKNNNKTPAIYNRLYSKGTSSSLSKRTSQSTEPTKENTKKKLSTSPRQPMRPRNCM